MFMEFVNNIDRSILIIIGTINICKIQMQWITNYNLAEKYFIMFTPFLPGLVLLRKNIN